MLKEKQRDKNSNTQQNPTTDTSSTNLQGPGGGGTGPGPGGGVTQLTQNGNNSNNSNTVNNNNSASGRGTPNSISKSSLSANSSPNSTAPTTATTISSSISGNTGSSSSQQSINNSNNTTNISNNNSNKNSNSNNQPSPTQNNSAVKEEQLEQGTTPLGAGGSNSNDSQSNLQIKLEEESPPNCGSNSSSGGNAAKKEIRSCGSGNIGSTNNGSISSLIKEDCSSNDEMLNDDSVNLNNNLQQQQNNQPSNQCGGSGMQIKTEDIVNDQLGGSDFLNNIQHQQSQISMPGGRAQPGIQPQTSVDGSNVQPLPSNVMNKQSNSMEYMQQQSQIFVFSSKLANTGAEAVLGGQFPSIIAYHCAQPGTKKFLEKHPLKLAQFNRQNPAQWINNLSLMKNKNNFRQTPGGAGGGGNNMAMGMGNHHAAMGKQPFGGNPGMIPTSGGGNQMNPHLGHPMQSQMGQGPSNFNMSSSGGPEDLLLGGGPENADIPSWDGPHNNHGLDSVTNGLVSGGSGGDSINVGLDVDNLVPGSPMQTGPATSGASINSNLSNLQQQQQQQSPPVSGAGNLNSNNLLCGPQSPSLGPGGLQPSLQGVKVPDENLTPQQRQHREEQLATLRRMQKMFFPEQGGPGGMGGPMPPDCTMGMDGLDPNALAMNAGGPNNPNNPCVKMGHPNNNMPMTSAGSQMMNSNIGGVGGPGMGVAGGPMLRGPMMPSGGMRPRGGGGMMNRPMMNNNMGPNPMNDQLMGPGDGPMNPENMNAMNCGPMGQAGGLMSNMGGPGQQMQMHGNSGGMMGNMMGGGGPNQMMGPMGGGMMGPGSGGMMGPGHGHGMMGQQGPGGMMGPGPGGMMGQKPGCMMSGGGPHNTVQAQMEWNKLQHQYFEEQRKGKGIPHGGMMMGEMGPMGQMGNICMPTNRQQMSSMMRGTQQGPRSQGPPPPYHQTPRSASVPISTQSPNPSSPNNPTSNLSLPSPRGGGGGSTLNSPADPTRGNSQQSFKHLGQSPTTSQDSPAGPNAGGGSQPPQRQMSTHSNPGTPISANLSPNASLKDIELGNNQNNSGKEPNLMPVPSPQQIQYLNTFEGQELTIQKQPNTNLKEGSGGVQNNTLISPSMDSNFGNLSGGPSSGGGPMSGPNTPSTPSSMEQRYSGTPGGTNSGGNQNISGSGTPQFPPIPSSPQTPTAGGPTPISSTSSTNDKNLRISSAGPSPQGGSRTPQMTDQPTNNENRFPSESPGLGFPGNQQQKHPSGGNNGPGGMKMGNFMNVSPKSQSDSPSLGVPYPGPGNMPGGPGPGPGVRSDLPLNPNSNVVANPKTSHFDPISSLAQMSQQLTSSVSALNGGPGGGGGPSGMGGPGGMVGPGGGMGGPGGQMMGPGGGYNMMTGNDMNAMGGMGGGMPGHPSHLSHHSHHPHGMDGMGMGGGPMDCVGMGVGPGGMGGMGGMGPGGMIGPGGMGGGPMGYGGGMGGSLSPKLGGQMMAGGGFPGPGGGMPRMMGRPMGPNGPYNGANIQVKASAPNTIQYLPARGTQVGNPNPRGPPSLEFLQRFANPNGGMDGKPGNGGGGMQSYFGNCNQGPMGPGGMGGGGGSMSMDNGPMSDMGGMGPMGGPSQMMTQNMMRMRPQGQMGMRMNGPPHGMFNNGGGNIPDGMFPGGGGGNHQMFGGGGGNKGVPLGETNYAQQYHNFQQQLYATNSRVQQGPGPGNNPQANNQQQFFVQNK